ncbi:MAG: hypothetical protein JJV98_17195 [Desulfosarcina sp.]|nr:hypothetical protein [Desulfobacterales bacterium]
MGEPNQGHADKREERMLYSNGKIYFRKEGERRFYFLLTIAILVAGILYKIGLF